MIEPKIKLNKKNDMDMLIEAYPNLSEDELLNGGCYILKMKNGSVIIYDCRGEYRHKFDRLRGIGYQFDKKCTHYKSKVATRHIRGAHHNQYYHDIKTVYLIKTEDWEAFCSRLGSYLKTLNNLLQSFTIIEGLETDNRYFCSPSLDVIVNVKPNGYILNPTFCKASAAYDAEEELCLAGPHSTGFTWWYYPGRMYFSVTKWKEISYKDYNLAKQFIFGKRARTI